MVTWLTKIPATAVRCTAPELRMRRYCCLMKLGRRDFSISRSPSAVKPTMAFAQIKYLSSPTRPTHPSAMEAAVTNIWTSVRVTLPADSQNVCFGTRMAAVDVLIRTGSTAFIPTAAWPVRAAPHTPACSRKAITTTASNLRAHLRR